MSCYKQPLSIRNIVSSCKKALYCRVGAMKLKFSMLLGAQVVLCNSCHKVGIKIKKKEA